MTPSASGPRDALLRLFSPEGRANPYPLYRDLVEQTPVLPVGGDRVIVLGFQEGSDVLLDTQLFPVPDPGYADRSWPGWRNHPSTTLLYHSLLFRNPPDNQPARRLVSRFVNPRRVRLLRPMIERHVAAQVAALVAGDGPVDATRSFTTVPNSVMVELLGLPQDDVDQVMAWLDMFLERNEMHPPDRRLASADDAAVQLVSYVRKTCSGRSADDASLAGLLAAEDSLDEQDVVSNLIFVLSAGTVTTGSLLGSGLFQLARDNDLLGRLRADDVLLRSFVLETLRHDPPIQYGARVAATDTELGGLPIARGSLILVCLGAIGRDARRFANPDDFLADRFVGPGADPRDVLSFGLGTHRCAGAELALVTAETAFAHLARRVDALASVSPPQRQNRTVVRRFRRLEVQVTPAPGAGHAR
ncbi:MULTISPECIES: cytochrome P450 [Micromonospora]|uniref:Cytochrome P450 n=1 Tax=Micromonospora yangpuensis TaxID=683228 RepID=A0A1C6UL87_9ACTN|nr:cytochrome P450 [Micromonospora yangpuensis]GGM17488.1 cytochrome P450 [Micromonospora yangpuensis]SCL54738.1 Cytochrome P450 [Micromonospora yangpuensis]